MAYVDYIHCMDCGEKALYWEQWDYIGCAHCVNDGERASRGVVEAYCPECTGQRSARRGVFGHRMVRDGGDGKHWLCECGEVDGDWHAVYAHHAPLWDEWRRRSG